MEREEDPRAGEGTPGGGGYGGTEPARERPAEEARYEPHIVRAGGEAPAGGGKGEWAAEGGEYGDDRGVRAQGDMGAIRAEDTEPYVGLQYVARLFKIVAMVVIVALTAEIVAALAMEGPSALFPLFLEVLQGAVLAALLWGASDLTLLFIDVGHDVRAQRVLLGRMSARMSGETQPPPRRRGPRDGSPADPEGTEYPR
ncbi:MAG TPA: hypothetical protein VHG91_03375 [Longimicrobium sp.]|nr:hypothetical protein [Longimicrobium sp.]